MSFAADIISWIFLLFGGAFAIIGGIGMLRLPDLYTRMHAAGITDTLGAGLIILGMAFQAGFTLVAVKLLLIIVFIFFTSPTATHAVAQAAIGGGLVPILDEDRRPGSDEEKEPSKT